MTLEPAAQIELSAGPFTDFDDARSTFERFEETLGAIVEGCGMRVLTLGYHPTACAAELRLIPKKRYKFMSLYFSEIGPWGARMMRGSASTQVSVDYTSEADCLRKLRLAYRIAPILALICDNAPLFEGGPRPHPLMRTAIWRECDADRCGVVPGAVDGMVTGSDGSARPFSWRAYAEYVLDTPAILVPCPRGEWCYSEETIGDFYAQETMGRADVEHALSMLFNDVRLKSYLEVRPADALPIPYAIAYAALVKGLLCDERSLDELDALFADVTERAIDDVKLALMRSGYRADVYGAEAARWADALVDIARRGLASDDQRHLTPLAELVAARETLADRALAQLRSDGRTA